MCIKEWNDIKSYWESLCCFHCALCAAFKALQGDIASMTDDKNADCFVVLPCCANVLEKVTNAGPFSNNGPVQEQFFIYTCFI